MGDSAATFVVGVTGGIGSGKSTVCSRFEDRYGVPVIDADIVAREVVAPGTEGLEAVVTRFGRDILTADGELDRRALKSVVFADDDKRHDLETMLHPRIRTGIAAHVAAVAYPYCLLCIPLLAEGGNRSNIDRVLVIDCPETLQVERVTARDDLTPSEVAAIMRTQASREQRLAIADDIVVNDGDDERLDQDIARLHQTYLQHAADAAMRTSD